MTPAYWKNILVITEPHEGKLGIGFLVLLLPGAYLTVFDEPTNECSVIVGIVCLATSFLLVGHYFVKWWFNRTGATHTSISSIQEWYGAVFFTIWYAIIGLILVMSFVGVLQKCII